MNNEKRNFFSLKLHLVGVGAAIGGGIGALFGLASGDPVVGAVLGTAIGMSVGATLSLRRGNWDSAVPDAPPSQSIKIK